MENERTKSPPRAAEGQEPPPFTHLAVTKTERRMDSRAFGNIRRQLSLWSRRWVGTRVPLGPNGGVLLGVFRDSLAASRHKEGEEEKVYATGLPGRKSLKNPQKKLLVLRGLEARTAAM